MASKFAASDINELLDCPVCLDRFSQRNRPKILACSHNVCTSCLQRLLVGQSLECPICRKQTSIQSGDVEMLITNLQTLQLVDLQPLDKCQACQQDSKTSQCFHCEQNVCLECLQQHTEETETKRCELQGRLNKSLKDVQEFKQNIDREMTYVESNAVTQTEQINTQFEMLIKQLHIRKDYLINEVNTYVESMKHQYEQIVKLEEQKSQPLHSVLTEVRDQVSDVRGNLTKQIIDDTYTTGIRIIIELVQTLPKCEMTFNNVLFQSKIDAVVGEIDQWGEVTSDKGVGLQYRELRTSAAKEVIIPQPVNRKEIKPDGSAVCPVEQRPAQACAQVDYTHRGRLVKRLQTWRSGGSQYQLLYPLGIAVDAVSEDVFVADGEPHHQVHVFTSSGQYLRSFGGRGRSLGQFYVPCGVSINHSKNVIVCEYVNNRCQMLTDTGESIKQFGQADSGNGAISSPADITVDDVDNMYVVSHREHCVKVYSQDCTFRSSFGAQGTGQGQFENPRYIQWSNGKLVICDCNGVQLWTDAGKFICPIGASTDPEPLIATCSVTADQHGSILVLDAADHTVKVFSAEGQFITKFQVAECQAERKNDWIYLACTPEGDVLVSHSKSQSVLFY